MASTTLYPPIIDAYMPAFEATDVCPLYFSMSEFSSTIEDVRSVHLSIIKQSSGQNVVNRADNTLDGRYRSTGIVIINEAPVPVPGQDNLYFVLIYPEDVKKGDYTGWQEGWIYKVQIRLSTVVYDGITPQAAWLNTNASNFSEWSTYCILKATGTSSIDIPILSESSLDLSTLEINGSYSNTDTKETLYSYQLQLRTTDDTVLEDSGILYTNEYFLQNKIYYLFKYELQNNTNYKVVLSYSTINKYEDEEVYNITIEQSPSQITNVSLITIENVDDLLDEDYKADFKSLTFKEAEEEEGRIGLKLYLDDNVYYTKQFYIRRASYVDNFTTWEDIKLITCSNQKINNLDLFYDYTIESSVWYKYGIQEYNPATQKRGVLNVMPIMVLRDFDFSYLIGEGGKQLKLKFDNIMGNYNYVYDEGTTNTLGGKYLFTSRNGNTEYRTFPITGTVSFNMDERQVFSNPIELFGSSTIAQAYADRHMGMYDYKREHEFRELVLKFLQDGKPKLFKSASEGNIIVRLKDVTTSPNQTTNRLICGMSATAYETADNTMENYRKFKFYTIGG